MFYSHIICTSSNEKKGYIIRRGLSHCTVKSWGSEATPSATLSFQRSSNYQPSSDALHNFAASSKLAKLWLFKIFWMNKSDNIQYNTLVRWDKWLVDQAFDVPSIIFFHNFLQNSLQKSFQFDIYFFYKFTNSFECPKSIRNYKKNNA